MSVPDKRILAKREPSATCASTSDAGDRRRGQRRIRDWRIDRLPKSSCDAVARGSSSRRNDHCDLQDSAAARTRIADWQGFGPSRLVGDIRLGSRRTECLIDRSARSYEQPAHMRTCIETVVANLLQSARQDVLNETAEKLDGCY